MLSIIEVPQLPQVTYWINPVVGMVVVLGGCFTGAWVILMVIRGRQAEVKALTEYRQKVLEKFSSAAEFTEFLKTDEGKKFLEPLAPVDPKQRIIQTTQRGIITALVGAALLIVSSIMSFYRPHPYALWFVIISSLILAVGCGFLIAARVSYRLSKSWNLFPDEKAAAQPAQITAANTP